MKNLIDTIQKYQQLFQIPGLSLRLVKAEETLFQADLGVQDLQTESTIHEKVRYRVACNSKPIAAMALLKLVEEDKLNLTDRVVDYIPELKAIRGGIDAQLLQIAHLINYSNGLCRGNYYQEWPSKEKILQKIAKSSFLYQPGQKFKYSNWAFFLLGCIIERITGKTREDYISDAILTPFGMEDSYFPNQKVGIPDALLATGYWREWYFGDPDISKPQCIAPTFLMDACAGGLISTANDFTKYIKVLLSGKNERGEEVLSSSIRRKLEEGQTNITKIKSASLGFFVDEYKGLKRVYFLGSNSGFSSYLTYFPVLNVGAVIMANQITCHPALKIILTEVFASYFPIIGRRQLVKIISYPSVVLTNNLQKPLELSIKKNNQSYLQFQGSKIPLLAMSSRSYLLLESELRHNILRIKGKQRKIYSITLGNQIFRHSSESKIEVNSSQYIGFYSCNNFGLIEIIQREQQLYLNWGIAYETQLIPLTDTVFRQYRGAFGGESLHFEFFEEGSENTEQLRIGEMIFKKLRE